MKLYRCCLALLGLIAFFALTQPANAQEPITYMLLADSVGGDSTIGADQYMVVTDTISSQQVISLPNDKQAVINYTVSFGDVIIGGLLLLINVQVAVIFCYNVIVRVWERRTIIMSE